MKRRIEDLARSLDDRTERLDNALPNDLARRRATLARVAACLRSPSEQLASLRLRLERVAGRLEPAKQGRLAAEQSRLDHQRFALRQAESRLTSTWPRRLAFYRYSLEQADRLEEARNLTIANESRRLDRHRAELRQLGDRLQMTRWLADCRQRVDRLSGLLESYSYEQVLRRGFALVRKESGEPVTGAGEARAGDRWTITFHDNQLVPVAVEAPPGEGPLHHRRKRTVKDDRQGSLL